MNITRESITMKNVLRGLSGAILGLLLTGLASMSFATTLQDISFASLPENKFEVRLSFDGTPPEVKGYSIERPARLALDLLGARSGLSEQQFNLGADNARSITVVEAGGRTRLIINLAQPTGYVTEVQGNDLFVILGERPEQPVFEVAETVAEEKGTDEKGMDKKPAVSDSADASATQAPPVPARSAAGISEVDFRRGPSGEGQIIVNLTRSSIPVDVRQEGSRVIARFVGARLPEDLRRRLDVTDFATPVRFVDARSESGSTVLSIEATGEWEYLAYQADTEFSINVKQLTQAEIDKRRRDMPQYTGEKLSLNFQDIEVRSVLQLIADFTGLNMVASDTVTGRITLRLQNVPWDQALDIILRTKGLDKRQVNNVLLVAPATEITAREQQELESMRQIEALAPLRTEFFRLSFATAADMAELIKSEGALLITDRGSVVVDERTNTLIINDTEAKLEDLRELITRLDVAVQQVLIEARVVIATSDLTDELGVRWGGLGWQGGRLQEDGRAGVVSGRAQNLLNFGIGVLNQDDIDIETPADMIVDMGVTSPDATRLSLGFLDLAGGILEMELSALASEGQGELIATPKVLTADQQPAVIASGTEIPYTTVSGFGTKTEFRRAELRLEVTPRLTPDGRIVMELKVNNDSVGQVFNNIPTIDVNRVETTVLVNDGETVVLGGIFQQQTVEGFVKTPFLGDLPWIGRLFRREFTNEDKQELLIFITPRLVKDTNTTI